MGEDSDKVGKVSIKEEEEEGIDVDRRKVSIGLEEEIDSFGNQGSTEALWQGRRVIQSQWSFQSGRRKMLEDVQLGW